MNNKIKGVIMMIPFTLFILSAIGIIIYENLSTTFGEVFLYLVVLIVVGIIALGSFTIAMIGYEKYKESEDA